MFCQANKRQDMHWPAQRNFFFSQLSDLGFLRGLIIRKISCDMSSASGGTSAISRTSSPSLSKSLALGKPRRPACFFRDLYELRGFPLSLRTWRDRAIRNLPFLYRSHGRSGPHSAGFSDKNPQRIWTRRAWHWKDRRAPCAQLEDIVRELLGKLFPLGPSGVE